jgi:hypothetical protein
MRDRGDETGWVGVAPLLARPGSRGCAILVAALGWAASGCASATDAAGDGGLPKVVAPESEAGSAPIDASAPPVEAGSPSVATDAALLDAVAPTGSGVCAGDAGDGVAVVGCPCATFGDTACAANAQQSLECVVAGTPSPGAVYMGVLALTWQVAETCEAPLTTCGQVSGETVWVCLQTAAADAGAYSDAQAMSSLEIGQTCQSAAQCEGDDAGPPEDAATAEDAPAAEDVFVPPCENAADCSSGDICCFDEGVVRCVDASSEGSCNFVLCATSSECGNGQACVPEFPAANPALLPLRGAFICATVDAGESLDAGGGG